MIKDKTSRLPPASPPRAQALGTSRLDRFLRNSGPVLIAIFMLGCGNFSNDDLIFLAAIPRAEELAIEVQPGSASGSAALASADAVGEPAEFYGIAQQVATDINAGVEELLTFVDSLGQGFRPTQREEDLRVWGPVENVDGSGMTLRLEIRRGPRPAEEGPRFTFCLQMGPDQDFIPGRDGCDEDLSNGLENVLSGHYDPVSATGGARTGSGRIRLDFEALQRLGSEEPEQGVLTVDYDFSNGGAAKALDVAWWVDATLNSPAETVSYQYNRTDAGEVDFFFEFQDDFVGGGLFDPFSLKKETLSIDACWTEDAPGRAEVLIRDGDIEPGESSSATECWDREQLRTYFRFEVSQDPDQNQEEGLFSLCPVC